MRKLVIPAAALLACMAAAILAAPEPTTRSDAVAGPGPDLSTPKSAALAFATALEAGDADAARRCALIGPQRDNQAIDCLAALLGGFKKLDQAATAKFGDAGKLIASEGGLDTSLVEKFKTATPDITGDTAQMKAGKDDKSPLVLRKVDEKWKVDMAALAGKGDEIVKSFPMMQAIGQAAGETAQNIIDGKYKTAPEAKQALGARAMSLLVGSITTQPSTQPATRP